MNGKKAKLIRRLAREAGAPPKPDGYTHIKRPDVITPTGKQDEKGDEIVLRITPIQRILAPGSLQHKAQVLKSAYKKGAFNVSRKK
jgi:hypothetical protein